jgi:hypothetical protein
LIKEFDKVLNGQPYSVLPINRLCESNPGIAQGLHDSRVSQLTSLEGLANHMLKRPADKPKTNQEVITRTALSVGTVDDDGQQVLCRPTNMHRDALNQVSKGTKRKAGANVNKNTVLSKLSLPQLKELAVAEKVVLPERTRLFKKDYVEAICLARTLVNGGDGEEDNIDEGGEGNMDVVADDVNEEDNIDEVMEKEAAQVQEQQKQKEGKEATAKKDREATVKQFIDNNTVVELIAIIAKENIMIKSGKKNKADYVNAIYLSRNPPQSQPTSI